jgi:hypothetical protein
MMRSAARYNVENKAANVGRFCGWATLPSRNGVRKDKAGITTIRLVLATEICLKNREE